MLQSLSRRGAQGRFNIFVVRPDRLGDVLLSTPVFAALKSHYPNAHITVLVQENVAPLLRGLPSVDEVLVYDPQKKHKGFRGFRLLVEQIRRRNFRIAIVLQSQWRVAWAVRLAGVRYRIGPLSKIHSFFVYNRGVRQNRSQVEFHEADYNLQLLRRLGLRSPSRKFVPQVSIDGDEQVRADQWLADRGVPTGETLIAVHPGMGGSALNWPETHYQELLRSLLREGKKVLVTGGPAEKALVDRLVSGVGSTVGPAIAYVNTERDSVQFLAALYYRCALVVAPSTGPLHLATAVGCAVVTFYPPIRVQSALRWGPYMASEDLSGVLVPEVHCGEDFKCRGSECHYFPCMKSITVIQALEEVQLRLTTGLANRVLKRTIEAGKQNVEETTN